MILHQLILAEGSSTDTSYDAFFFWSIIHVHIHVHVPYMEPVPLIALKLGAMSETLVWLRHYRLDILNPITVDRAEAITKGGQSQTILTIPLIM